jgi:tetratricopeptide (TPR) repeat protein
MLDDNPSNPLLNYHVGRTHWLAKNFREAIVYLERAVTMAPEVDEDSRLMYSKALSSMGELDKAEDQIQLHRKTLQANQKYRIEVTNRQIQQIALAKKLRANPVNVTITNLGDAINSKNDEHGPSISNDGMTLIFTSRRPNTKGGGVDPFDNKFLEDIYMSTYDEESNSWSNASQVKGKLNTYDHDGCLSLSPDGQYIYVYRNEGEAGGGAGDIYVSKKSSSGKWGVTKKIEGDVNSSYFESSATVTKDGNRLYFISERLGGMGQSDIYYVEKKGREWSEAKNIGPVINTEFDERMVFIHPDGNTLFFSSDGHPSLGGFDIYKSNLVDGKWTTPINVGYPINTVNDEINFTLTADGKKAYTSAVKSDGFGGNDLYEIDLSDYDILKKAPEQYMVFQGKIIDEKKKSLSDTKVELMDKSSGTVIAESTTMLDGTYVFTVERGKEYKIKVSKSGYRGKEKADLKVGEKTVINTDFTLKM